MARKRSPTDPAAKAHRVEDFARRYSVGTSTVWAAIRRGDLKASKLGNFPRSPVVITDEAGKAWIDSCQIQSEAA